MVTTHANTKFPYQGMGAVGKQFCMEALRQKFKKVKERSFFFTILHIFLFCCHLNSISSLVATGCKLKTCINNSSSTNHAVYSGYFLKSRGNTAQSTKLGWCDPQLIASSHLQAIPSGASQRKDSVFFQLLILIFFAMYSFYGAQMK